MNDASENLALVLGGGGARAAYQAGFLRRLAKEIPGLNFPIITGVSAGSINAAFLANWSGTAEAGVERLTELWQSITPDQIFYSSPLALAANVCRWGLRLVSGGAHLPVPPRGLVDTEPLRRFLRNSLDAPDGLLRGIAENIRNGRLKAAAITTTNYARGQSVTWTQGDNLQMWERPLRHGALTTLNVEHVMGSCALPLFFPAIRIGDGWHGDGGIRLMAPLSPALHLGAQRILTISTRYLKSYAEAAQTVSPDYPPPATVIGVLLNAVFLDALDHDALVMQRISEMLARLPEPQRQGLRPVELLVVRPSQDLEALAADYEHTLPRAFRYMVRGLGTRDTPRTGLLATILFAPEYVRRVMEVGEQDAARRAGELSKFLKPEAPAKCLAK
jgi:NTE family protein